LLNKNPIVRSELRLNYRVAFRHPLLTNDVIMEQ
jgi:hypothetical protein